MTSSDNVRAQAVRLHPLLGFCLVFIICSISCIDDISRQSVSQSHDVEGSSLKCIVGFTREKMYLASDLVELNLVNSIKHRSKALQTLSYLKSVLSRAKTLNMLTLYRMGFDYIKYSYSKSRFTVHLLQYVQCIYNI